MRKPVSNWFSSLRDDLPYRALILFLIIVFLTGGSSRPDVQSLIILRPAAIVFCGVAALSLKWAHFQQQKFLSFMVAAIVVLTLLYILPLPPTVWPALPGREIIQEVDRLAGLGQLWRSASMVPEATKNTFFSLFVPLAVFLLAIQLKRDQLFGLLPAIVGLALLSGLIGMFQIIGDPSGPLYFYRISNFGSGVGLFANRNHQAILLASVFPMLSVYASATVQTPEQVRLRSWIALSAGAVLTPLLLVTGSRTGLVVGLLGMVFAALIYSRPKPTRVAKRKVERFDLRIPLAFFGLLILGALSIIMSRAEAFSRLAAPDAAEEQRLLVWGPILEIGWKYFPVGSGPGTFVETYQIDEPTRLLSLTYLNHAHNDWLELFITGGLPAMLLVAVSLVAYYRSARPLIGSVSPQRRGVMFGRLGAALLLLFGASSLVDYPLRTPTLSCLFIIAAMWIAAARSDPANPSGEL